MAILASTCQRQTTRLLARNAVSGRISVLSATRDVTAATPVSYKLRGTSTTRPITTQAQQPSAPQTRTTAPRYQALSQAQAVTPRHTFATMTEPNTQPYRSMQSSGAAEPVWTHKLPWSKIPEFPSLDKDLETDIAIIGAGIAGISTAYELVKRGKQVTLVEARNVLSGESGRTSGHLTNDLDDGFVEIAKKHGEEGAKHAAASHAWARDRIGEIAKELNIDCEYRKLPAYDISQFPVGEKKHDDEMQQLKEEAEFQKKIGMETTFDPNLTVRGWNSSIDQRGGMVADNQATFHPTRYLVGVLNWLKTQPNFQCYARTRVMDVKEKGIELLGMGHKRVEIKTENGHTITAENAIEATCIPLQKLSVITQLEYYRTYCIAVRVPKGSVEDCLLYDNAEEYKYVRLTECDEKDDYMVVGGCDHKVGQEETTPRFDELEKWTRERFPQVGSVDYKWSGQIFEPVDYMGFIGKNQGNDKIYIITGDSGDGLTHGVLAGRLLADEIDGIKNPWAELYNPKRVASILKSLPSMLSHDLEVNAQYKRFLQTDIQDIEDLPRGCGGVLNKADTKKPIAVYKDENGNVKKFSALCPHLKGVVCWNAVEKSFDCPVHGSRFSKEGICVSGPAKAGLSPADEAAEKEQVAAAA
ncbi:hypothetical protein SMACR_07575 [Sordaria macrospora]|uniref:WGS project CABT00000000 data, contig 2.27 n=2 Tax=Sordaria macrospora TaxID=5147 RepID=F7W497_SORMK|nr:uncharacterized protein SMAC_07575 [Sordaria macrospora k-hell]KAA8634939.1 hypothetical protein SMACR_07575 [Sordaria macrospora]KAH7635413.1 FAD dependent oxidoreductase-domain-containing protein [Sordaria sp. MPI-SDFR-AT-0083]WPJ67348.1 hypothetical protein SMAC4_07575 [Sordaria macrospora]CCC14850.1 unnamed protein product [Sordaria macrospora k-hell]